MSKNTFPDPLRRVPSLSALLVVAMVGSLPLIGFAPLSVGTVGIKFSWLVGLCIIVTGGIRAFRRGSVRWSTGMLLLGLWLGWSVSTGIWPLLSGDAVKIREFIFGVLRLAAFFGVILGLYNLDLDRSDLQTFFRATAAVAVLVSCYAIYQFFAREYQLPFAYLQLTNPSLLTARQVGGTYYTGGVFYRVTSLFPEPSWLGMYLADVLFIVAIPLLYGVSEDVLFDSRQTNLAVLSLVTTAFVVAYSLGAYVALFLTAAFVVTIDWSNILDRFASTLAVPSLAFLLFDLVVAGGRITLVVLKRVVGLASKLFGPYLAWLPIPSFSLPELPAITLPSLMSLFASSSGASEASGAASSQAVETVTRSSLDIRAARIASGIDVWRDHLFTGVGLNNYQFYAERGVERKGHAFNWTFNYLKILAEQGIIGLLVFTLAVILVLRRFVNAADTVLETGDETAASMLRAFFTVIVFAVVSAMFVDQFFTIRIWFYLGMGFTAISIAMPDTVRTVSIPIPSFPNWVNESLWS